MVDVSQQVTVVIDPRHEHKFVLQHAVTVAIDILHQYRVEQLIDHLHERSIAVEIVGDNRCSNCGRHIPENSQYCPLCEAQDNPSLEESDLPDFNATDEPTLNDDRETFDEGEDRSFLSTVKPIDIQQYLTEFIAAHLIICEEDAELIAIILQASITGRLHSINRDTISTILADEVIDRARELLAFYQNCLPELEVQLPVTVTASGELREAIASIIITRQDDSLSCSIPSRLDDLMLAKSKRNELITFGDIKLPAVLIYRGLLHNRDQSAGLLSGAGQVQLSALLPTNVVVALSADLPNALGLPPVVLIPAGQSGATFDRSPNSPMTITTVTCCAPCCSPMCSRRRQKARTLRPPISALRRRPWRRCAPPG